MNPYHYQTDILRAIRDGKNVCTVIHRRAGKDLTCVQAWLMRALMRVGTHIYLFPLTKQAREVIWNGIDHQGRAFISYIPKILIASRSEATMTIKLINGSRMVLAGSNNFNSHMGSNPVTIINSEFSLHNPLARQYMNPILVQNGGIEILQYTPRGMNHGYEVLEQVRDNPKYLVQVLGRKQTFKHDGTHVITDEMIEHAKAMGMSEETIRQEFDCDFFVGNVGSYFTREVTKMHDENRIMSDLKPRPDLPLHTAWDLGRSDATAIWFFQIVGNYVHLVHYFQESDRPMSYFVEYAEKYRQNYGCRFGMFFGPHDIKQETQGWEYTESRLKQARAAGYHFQVTPKVNFGDGIEQMRFVMDRMRIDKNECALGLRAIREYSRKYDEVLQKYSHLPVDAWYTHAMDALRYLCVNYRRLFEVPEQSKIITHTRELNNYMQGMY